MRLPPFAGGPAHYRLKPGRKKERAGRAAARSRARRALGGCGGRPWRARPFRRRELDAEHVGEPGFAGRRQPHRAAVALAHEPAELQAAAPDRRADEAGDVMAALAPVEAGAAEDALAARRQIGAEAGEEGSARRRQLAAVLAEHDMAAGGERGGYGNGDLAGEMVVAGAREAQRVVADRARLVARRHLEGGDRDDAFDHARDQRRGDAVVAEAPLPGDGDEPRFGELEQVLAGGRAGNA